MSSFLLLVSSFRHAEVNALAEQMEGQSVSWWPPCLAQQG